MDSGQLFRQCVGIDISKSSFTACVCQYYISDLTQYSGIETFKNDKSGFNQFVKWSRKHILKNNPVTYLMEATGVYYESLAYHLHKLHLQVMVVLPNKAKHYMLSEGIKTKTDEVDARNLALMGAFTPLTRTWSPPNELYRKLRSLTRLNSELMKQRTRVKNNLEAIKHTELPEPFVKKSYAKMLKHIDDLLKENAQKIKELIKTDKELYQRIKKLETIKGVALTTVAIILAETQGFALISNKKQLASYAGLDVVQRQSGSSVCGKTRISKKGNSRIRAALYMPAIVASTFNPQFKEDYTRIVQKHPKQKKIAITAIQRKLLLLMYAMWKNGESYDPKK